MYSWQSSLQPRQRHYDSSSPRPIALDEQEGAGGEDGSRWGRWEHESRIPLGGYSKPPEWSACGNNPSQLPGGTWERGVGLVEDEEEERKRRRRWEQPHTAVRAGTKHLVPPSTESFPPLHLDETVKGVYPGPDPPPSRLCVYLYRIIIPYRNLGAVLIGPAGSTQIRILKTAGLVRFSLEPERLRFADLVGSREAIERGLELVREEAERGSFYSSSSFAIYDERNLVQVPRMWLEERFAKRSMGTSEALASTSQQEMGDTGASEGGQGPSAALKPPFSPASPRPYQSRPSTFRSTLRPPLHRQAYRYHHDFPHRTIGATFFGMNGETQSRIACTTGLVSLFITIGPDRHANMDMIGSEQAIRRALALIERTTYEDLWPSWSDKERIVLERRDWCTFSWKWCYAQDRLWLDEAFSDPVDPSTVLPPLPPGPVLSWPYRGAVPSKLTSSDELHLQQQPSRPSPPARPPLPSPARPSQFKEDYVEAAGHDHVELEEPTSRKRRRRRSGEEDAERGARRLKKRAKEREAFKEEEQSLAVAFPIPTTAAIRFLHPSSALAYIEDNTGSSLTLISQGNVTRLGIVAPDAEALENAIVLVETVVGIDEKGWRVPRAGGGKEAAEQTSRTGKDEEMADFKQAMSENGGREELADENKLRSLALSSRADYRNSRQSPSSSSCSDPFPTHSEDSSSLRRSSFRGRNDYSRSTIDTASDRSDTPSSPRFPSAVQRENGTRPRPRWTKAFDAEERYEQARDSGKR